MTPAEMVLWQHLRANQLDGFRFRRQQIIDGYIVDFYCHRARLVVEVDGGVHTLHTDRDAARDEILAARGLTVLRVTNDEVLSNMPAVIAQICDACRRDIQRKC
jgi:very-short-patch-repair endonuclease